MTDLRHIAADLAAEQEALDGVVAGLDDAAWRRATPSPGWTVADQIGHLTYYDGAAALAITDPEAFRASVDELLGAGAAGGGDGIDGLTLHRDLSRPELLAAWRAGRRRLAEAAAGLGERDRVAWYGPSMGAKSFLTARLMECWAHGQDIVDALGVERPATDRLRHIARLGVITRGWTYANRGLEPPPGDVRIEVTGPAGEGWSFGPEGESATATGPALDFCMVVTQRRHVDDTALRVTGEAALDWLTKAQVFAGPPTDPPAPGTRFARSSP